MRPQVGIIGSGNWGTTVSKLIGENVASDSKFEPTVLMWVLEEDYDGDKLSNIINTRHENAKYLPGIKLPTNVVAETDIMKVATSCTHLVFVVPHQFIESTCDKIAGKVPSTTIGISLIKGLIDNESEIVLPSSVIASKLKIHMSALSGANIANEIAACKFSTSTIGCDHPEYGVDWKFLFSRPYFKIDVIKYTIPMEIFGALKNCIAVGIGFCDALGLGNNAKASAIRVGFVEIIKFVHIYQPDCALDIFHQSFGLDDLITTCFGGRNVRAAEVFIRTKKALAEIERELLNGQKLQGPSTANTVYKVLKCKNKLSQFPFMTYVHDVLNSNADPASLLEVLRR